MTRGNGIPNHRASKHRYAEREGVPYFVSNDVQEVRCDCAIDDNRRESFFPYRGCETQKPKRRTEDFPSIGRREKQDLVSWSI
jgi:hypothetical protein